MTTEQSAIDLLAETPIPPQRLLIGGEWVTGEGEPMPVLSPIDGRTLTTLSTASAADVARACADARAAFEDNRWSGKAPAERKKILHRLADLIDKHTLELAVLGVRDNIFVTHELFSYDSARQDFVASPSPASSEKLRALFRGR